MTTVAKLAGVVFVDVVHLDAALPQRPSHPLHGAWHVSSGTAAGHARAERHHHGAIVFRLRRRDALANVVHDALAQAAVGEPQAADTSQAVQRQHPIEDEEERHDVRPHRKRAGRHGAGKPRHRLMQVGAAKPELVLDVSLPDTDLLLVLLVAVAREGVFAVGVEPCAACEVDTARVEPDHALAGQVDFRWRHAETGSLRLHLAEDDADRVTVGLQHALEVAPPLVSLGLGDASCGAGEAGRCCGGGGGGAGL